MLKSVIPTHGLNLENSMLMTKKVLKRSVVGSLLTVLLLELTACGTVFYPERKGTVSGEIDPVVAIGDAVGLLFFLLPGVIAFAVDFTNGTIYLPHGKHSQLTPEELKNVQRAGKLNDAEFNRVMSDKLGMQVDVQARGVHKQQLSSLSDLALLGLDNTWLASR
jgi:hypothetical protein